MKAQLNESAEIVEDKPGTEVMPLSRVFAIVQEAAEAYSSYRWPVWNFDMSSIPNEEDVWVLLEGELAIGCMSDGEIYPVDHVAGEHADWSGNIHPDAWTWMLKPELPEKKT